MPKIMKAYAGTGLEPKIEVTNNAFKITLPNRNAVKAMDAVSNERKSNEEKILDLIAKNGYVVRNDVDQLFATNGALRKPWNKNKERNHSWSYLSCCRPCVHGYVHGGRDGSFRYSVRR